MNTTAHRDAPTGTEYERPRDIVRRTRMARATVYDTLKRGRADGRIPVFQSGRSILVPAGAFDRYLADETERLRQA